MLVVSLCIDRFSSAVTNTDKHMARSGESVVAHSSEASGQRHAEVA